jgi:DNA polymerase-4
MRRAGLRVIGQLAGMPVDELAAVAGGQARALEEFARGIDPRPVVPGDQPAKSYGAQETFQQDTCDPAVVRATLRVLADGLLGKVREDKSCARTVAVKIRYTDMQEAERSTSLAEPSFLPEDFYPAIENLLKQAWDRRVRLRMVRVRFSSIYHHWPMPDLLHKLDGRDKLERIQSTLAAVQSRFGKQSLMRGHEWQQIIAARSPGESGAS